MMIGIGKRYACPSANDPLREQVQRKKWLFSLFIFNQTPSCSLNFSVNFYLYLPVLHLQLQNHILNANRATVIDPWCV